jgi:hypothetical protein
MDKLLEKHKKEIQKRNAKVLTEGKKKRLESAKAAKK